MPWVRRSAARAGLCVLAGAVASCFASVTGTVYVDRNHDGLRQADEPGVAGAVVAVDRMGFFTTDDRGNFAVDLPSIAGLVWVRVPDGFRPGPVWARAAAEVELGLIPLTADQLATPLTFVVAADSHTAAAQGDPWDDGDLAGAIDQAVSLPDPPRFFTIVGDITQSNKPEQFDKVEDALSGVETPWVPVPGNHDWYDGGAAWRSHFGPDAYSFDMGDVHVMVWDTNLPVDDQLAFVAADLAAVPPSMTVVGLGHHSPTDEVADRMAALGVDYLFTGHWHSNRLVERAGLTEWGTQTFIMGTIDQSPAGYRIVTFDGGPPRVEHRERMVRPALAVTAPHPGSCASPTGFDILVAAALDATPPQVTARIDCGAAMPLTARGGWSHGGRAPALAPGTHSLTVRATTPAGRTVERQVGFEVCTRSDGAIRAGDWLQAGGGPEHAGAAPAAIVPPLQVEWSTSVGGVVVRGSPVVAGGTVIVPVSDLGAGDRGGVVALDLADGHQRWRFTTTIPLHNGPAVDGDTVVVALADGQLLGLDLADGRQRWRYDLAAGLDGWESSLWSAPAIADGAVLAAVQGRVAALDVATGVPRWERDLLPVYPWLGSLAAVTVAGGTAVINTSRDDGMVAWDSTTGDFRWQVRDGRTVAVNATPVASGSELFVANAAGRVTAFDLATGDQRWSTIVTPGGFEWGYVITAAPAVAGGRLFVPTQWTDLVALDTATGAELWRVASEPGPLSFAHYRSDEPGFVASPVVTGDVVWAPRPDGVLLALGAADGNELWRTDLGAPLVSAPVPAGDYLVVASYDGTVRALAAATPAVPGPVTPCPDPPPDPDPEPAAGCCALGGDGLASIILTLIVLVGLARRRRPRPCRS